MAALIHIAKQGVPRRQNIARRCDPGLDALTLCGRRVRYDNTSPERDATCARCIVEKLAAPSTGGR